MVALGHMLRSQQTGEANNPRHGYLWIKRLDATWPLLQCCQKLQVASLKLKMQEKSSTFPSNQRKLNLFCQKNGSMGPPGAEFYPTDVHKWRVMKTTSLRFCSTNALSVSGKQGRFAHRKFDCDCTEPHASLWVDWTSSKDKVYRDHS